MFDQWAAKKVSSGRLILRCLTEISKSTLSILIYHRVYKNNDPLRPQDIDAETFSWQIGLVKECFNILPLDEAVSRLNNDSLPKRALSITFDDGYADNESVAYPILEYWDIPATFFIATGYIGGGIMWNDKVIEAVHRCESNTIDLSEIGLGVYLVAGTEEKIKTTEKLITLLKHRPQDERDSCADYIASLEDQILPRLMMTEEQIRKLASAGMEVGGHTITHPILATLNEEDAFREIAQCREQLREITGQTVSSFAYPNGKPNLDYLPVQVGMVKRAGYTAAVSTIPGVSTKSTDRMQLARFTPWDRTPDRFLMRLALNSLKRK